MSGEPEVLQGRATPEGARHAAWSVVRAAAFGLAAAVACAGVYAAVVILTGYEIGLVAIALGAGVGFAVMAGDARVAEGWVRALSVLLTLFSLLLSSYLLIWLYDGEGLAPAPVSVGEAAAILREFLTEEPMELLFWGLAMLTALGIGNGEDSEEGGDAADAGTAPSWPLVQVVDVEPHPVRAPDMELVVVMAGPSGGFRLRRVSLVASDLPGALPHLFAADPEDLRRPASPLEPIRVIDRAYDSGEEAMAAAHGQHPAADPDDWVDGAEFCASVEDDADFSDLLKPSAERTGVLGGVVVGLAGVFVAAVVIYAGYRLNVLVGLDTPERRDTLPDQIFFIVVVVLAIFLAVVTGRRLARVLARRNLAKARAQEWPSRAPLDASRDPRHGGVSDHGHIESVRDDFAGPGRSTEVADIPATLVERPRVRLFWCALLWTFAAAGAVVAIVARDELGGAWTLALVGGALALTLLGVVCLRWSIVADASGVTITNVLRRHTILWSDLNDVRLEKVEADIDLGFHYLVFTTHAGQRIRADAPTGRIKPGGKMLHLQKTLLGMKHRYAPSTGSVPASALGYYVMDQGL